MAVKTYAEQLEAVQLAISKIEAGAQSYTVEGNAFSRGDLKTLYEREERLRALATREAAGGGMRVRLARPI